MVPNGHTATYVFFKSIIKLGLCEPHLGFVRKVDHFLYRWGRQIGYSDEHKKRRRRDERKNNR